MGFEHNLAHRGRSNNKSHTIGILSTIGNPIEKGCTHWRFHNIWTSKMEYIEFSKYFCH